MTTGRFSAPSSAVRRAMDLLSELVGAYRWRALAGGAAVAFGVVVKSPSRIRFGRGVLVPRGCVIHGGGKAWCGYAGHVIFGDGVKLGPHCVIYGAGGVTLLDNVHLGPGAKVMSQSGLHSSGRETGDPDYKLEPVVIGQGTWIGAGAVILGGARLGRSVSVAPNAVVSGEIPDFAVVAGNPARIVFRNQEHDRG